MRWMIVLALGACAPDDHRRCEVDDIPLRFDTYHGDERRLGWNDRETELTPTAIAADGLVARWSSAPLDAETIDGITYAPHLYAVPLWLDDFPGDDGPTRAVITATSNGWVYAIAADDRDCAARAPGEILWATRLVDASVVTRLDGGMPLGVLSTPILDRDRLFVAAMDRERGWLAFALDTASGEVLEPWPVAIDDANAGPKNTNGPATLHAPEIVSQRGALKLSPQGDRLYVPFGTYRGEGVGWLVAIDTADATIAAAFSSAQWTEPTSSGGIWGAGGPAVDDAGDIWLTTGNSPPLSAQMPGTWGNSLLRLDRDLVLEATYTPFNYCWLDLSNMDIAASPPLLLPPLAGTSTPDTVAFGGKQGNVYLVDRSTLLPAGASRPNCSDDAAADRSLLPPVDQAQFGTRGPLNVFGPYSERFGQLDYAKMRSRVAYAELDDRWLFASGSTKAAEDSETSVAPSLAKLRVVAPVGAPAYLETVAYAPDVVFLNPGAPIVSSDADSAGVVWVIDENAPRTASLLDPATPDPILYAFDAETLTLLWRSDDGALGKGGKYGTAVVAHGVAIIGTDRITAFGRPR